MERKFLFDTIVSDYAQARPGYPQQLMDDLLSVTKLSKNANVLEIGCGAGQATQLLVNNQMNITAVELGKNLAEYTKNRFIEYPHIQIHNSAFEEFIAEKNSYDLIFSASAFHWINPEIGYQKAFDLLKDIGWLLLCWNSKADQKDVPIFKQINQIYEEVVPEMNENKNSKIFQHETRIEHLIKDGLFSTPLFFVYSYDRVLNADEYVQLLGTYSDHIALDIDKENTLFTKISDLIRKNENTITLNYELKTYLAKKNTLTYLEYL